MSPLPTSCLAGVKSIPPSTLALSSFPTTPSYADFFTIRHVTKTTDPEKWARTIFGNTPSLTQRIIWTGLLGLPLVRKRTPDVIAGWRIGGQGKDWVRMENRSWLLSGNLVVVVSEDKVSVATFVRYESWFAWVWWPALAVLHRALMPGVLRGGVGRMESRMESRMAKL
jgi:hypothetical protein